MSHPVFVQPPYPWFFSYWQQFIAQYQAERLPHAILLKGGEGIGASQLAVAMAQYLMCRAPADSVSCGRCRSCELMAAETHPDFMHIHPEEKSTVVKVAQVRAVGDFVANTAQQGGRKVIVLEPAESMNMESANALLKNLEEPAGDTVFILVAHQVARVLPTVRSRTSQVALETPSQAESVAWLERNKVAQPESLLAAAGGAPIRALEWFENNTLEHYQEVAELFQASFKREKSVVEVAKKLSSYDLIQVMSLLQQWLQRAILRVAAEKSDDLPVVVLLSRLPAQGLYRLLDAAQARIGQLYAGSNPNKALACEELLLMIQGVEAEFARRQ